jgi:hypothetical protein
MVNFGFKPVCYKCGKRLNANSIYELFFCGIIRLVCHKCYKKSLEK